MKNDSVKIIVCNNTDNNENLEISVDAQCLVEISKHILKNEHAASLSSSTLDLLNIAESLGNDEASSILKKLRPPYAMAVRPFTSYDGIINYLANKYKYHRPIEHHYCMIGILFVREGTKINMQLLEELEYYHHRSLRDFDLFIAGYGDSPWKERSKKANFSPKHFSKIIEQFEAVSEWKYSGGSELILTNVKASSTDVVSLDFSSSIIINLDELVENKGFRDIGYFFEYLFDWSRHSPMHKRFTWDFSDHYIKERFPKEISRFLMQYLPRSSKNSIKEIASFAVRNIEKT